MGRLGKLLVVCLVIVAGFSLLHHRHKQDGQTSAPQEPVSSSAAHVTTPGTDAPSLTASKNSLNARVKTFAALYYSLSPAKSAAEVQRAVTPYATQHFLQTAQFGFGTSEADQSMLREGESLRVTATSGLVGELATPDTASGSVRLHVVQYDHDGNVVQSFNYQQAMTWVRQGNAWFIDEAPRT
jgi:hypothetical protein